MSIKHHVPTFKRSKQNRLLRIEPLEARRVLAATTVTTLGDTVDAADGLISLREAVMAANASPGQDDIDFAPELFGGGPAILRLRDGEFVVTDSLTIVGPGANLLTLDASDLDSDPAFPDGQGVRILRIDDGDNDHLIDVAVSGLSLTGGDVGDAPPAGGFGGAIFSVESVQITNCNFFDNAAESLGGAIAVHTAIGAGMVRPTLTVTGSTITGNTSRGGGCGISALGANVVIDACTISGNSSIDSIFDEAQGGGIRIALGTVAITSSVISGNSAGRGGGGVYIRSTSMTMENCTVSMNSSGGGTQFGSGGGGILRNGGSIFTLRHCQITGNTASHGGGVEMGFISGTMLIADCDITANTASIRGGGVANYGSATSGERATMLRCNISNNSSPFGGGVSGRALDIIDSSISRNTADDGGGLGLADSTLIDCTINSNTADSGGGISANGTLEVIDCTISFNTADSGGGISANGTLEVVGCTISGNGSVVGGALASGAFAYDMTVKHSTITGNYATAHGGGIFINSGSLHLDHTILAGNNSSIGPDVTGILGVTIDAVFSLIGDNSQSGIPDAPVGMPDAHGNLFGGPLTLGPLADNGGPTFTHALLAGQAINSGSPTSAAGSGGVPVNDQRGAPFGRVVDGRIDIGAVENQPINPSADFDGDLDVDGVDFLTWQRGFLPFSSNPTSGTHATGDANYDHKVNGADFTIWKATFGAATTAATGLSSAASAIVSQSAVPAAPEAVDAALAYLQMTATPVSRPLFRPRSQRIR